MDNKELFKELRDKLDIYNKHRDQLKNSDEICKFNQGIVNEELFILREEENNLNITDEFILEQKQIIESKTKLSLEEIKSKITNTEEDKIRRQKVLREMRLNNKNSGEFIEKDDQEDSVYENKMINMSVEEYLKSLKSE